MSKSAFIKEFLSKKKMVGSVVPSSKFLSRKMLDHLNFKQAKLVVELGPGTGVFTQRIIEKLDEESKLLVIELNDAFYRDLKNKISDKRVTIRKGSASDLPKFMSDLNIEKADFIVSSLPLAILPKTLRKRIVIEANNHLNIGGEFIQFQYTLQSLKLFKKVFEKVSVRHCLFNIPPAFVYSCKKQ
ncbi:methyltransferase domain-containing protein [Crocinitomicaceae bacterium]|nr:methyltransferase domain-containing protein [Crocinitomicaceae bacterium]MDC1244815.1 methyltransferase domain-containing protein [Crocinitomicaceae bacterium]